MPSRRAFLAALGVLLATWVLLAWLIDRAGVVPDESDTEGTQEVVVVLGARVDEDGRPSLTLRTQVEHAVRVLERWPAAVVLFSGGVGTFGASEASVARDLALSLGVPIERCLVEEASHSTAQDLVAFRRAVYTSPSAYRVDGAVMGSGRGAARARAARFLRGRGEGPHAPSRAARAPPRASWRR